jgi:hypothetical protein
MNSEKHFKVPNSVVVGVTPVKGELLVTLRVSPMDVGISIGTSVVLISRVVAMHPFHRI